MSSVALLTARSCLADSRPSSPFLLLDAAPKPDFRSERRAPAAQDVLEKREHKADMVTR